MILVDEDRLAAPETEIDKNGSLALSSSGTAVKSKQAFKQLWFLKELGGWGTPGLACPPETSLDRKHR